MGNLPYPLGAMFLTDQNRFSFICRMSSSNHIYYIGLNSDGQFQRRIFFKDFVIASPLADIFLGIYFF